MQLDYKGSPTYSFVIHVQVPIYGLHHTYTIWEQEAGTCDVYSSAQPSVLSHLIMSSRVPLTNLSLTSWTLQHSQCAEAIYQWEDYPKFPFFLPDFQEVCVPDTAADKVVMHAAPSFHPLA